MFFSYSSYYILVLQPFYWLSEYFLQFPWLSWSIIDSPGLYLTPLGYTWLPWTVIDSPELYLSPLNKLTPLNYICPGESIIDQGSQGNCKNYPEESVKRQNSLKSLILPLSIKKPSYFFKKCLGESGESGEAFTCKSFPWLPWLP